MRIFNKIHNFIYQAKRKKIWKADGIYIAKGSKVDKNVIIGRYTKINEKSHIGPCIIGSFVSCGGRLVVRSSDHFMCYPNIQGYTQKYVIRSHIPVTGKKRGTVVIGNASWIGDSVLVLPGASVGNGAIIGAGSVVTRSIPDYSVAVGNPAKVIKKRFSNECIDLLIKLCLLKK